MSKKINTLVLILSGFFILCLIPSQFPFVQRFAVEFVEKLKNDDINDPFWMKQMSAFGIMGILFILAFDFFFITQKGREIIKNFVSETREIITSIKQNKKYLFILMGLYTLSYFTIIRANFANIIIDDMGRQIEGVREWMNFYRYIDEIGSIFIHTSKRLMDIAPLTQFIAIFFLSLSSFFAIKIFNKDKFTIPACFISLLIGIFPYFLANVSYRYDSPYMALSVLASIIPFLFFNKKDTFIFTSVICLLIMCMTYQASSGIYIMMSVLCVIYKWLLDKENFKEILKTTGICILCFCVTLFSFYKIFSISSETEIYVDESINIAAIIPNCINYIKVFLQDFNKTPILIFSVLIILLSVILLIKNSKQKKAVSIPAVIILVLFSIPLSFGIYIALGNPSHDPRGMYGIGILIALLSIILYNQLSSNPKVIRIISYIFLTCFIYSNLVFSFAYGNAQAEQKNYINFRATLLLNDLANIVEESDEPAQFVFKGDIGHAAIVQNMIKVYPVMGSMVDTGLKMDRYSTFVLESLNFFTLVSGSQEEFTEDFPIVFENQYHRIQKKGNKYIVTYKNPGLKVIKVI
jgi:hypothetical protein